MQGLRKKNDEGQDFDLNLAPIIDALTVLITFMLVSASFLAIGVFDANVAANAAEGNDSKPPAIRIDILLTTNQEIRIRVSGKIRRNKRFKAGAEGFDSASLARELKSLKSRYPKTEGYILNAQDDVEYKDLIKVMESLRADVPKMAVLLGGL